MKSGGVRGTMALPNRPFFDDLPARESKEEKAPIPAPAPEDAGLRNRI